MFLHDAAPKPYVDPWSAPVEWRLAQLSRRSKRVAYFYDEVDNSTFRYRVYNMIQVLTRQTEDVSAAWFCSADRDSLAQVVRLADILVIGRVRYSHHVAKLIAMAKSAGVLVIFDCDDFVFDTRYVHLLVHTLDQDFSHPGLWDFWFAYVSRMGETLRLCDRVIVTNAFLAERVRGFVPDMDVRLVRNFMNDEQLAFSEQIFASKRRSGFASDGRIHIGYFSGSPTHNRDFELATGALAALLERDPRIVVRLVGFMEPTGPLARHVHRIDRQPFHDFIALQGLIGSTEINVVPLQDNIFTNCKSELKFFEAAAVGSLTVATPTFVYAGCIRDGENGFLARPHAWGAALDRAVELVDRDRDAMRVMIETAHADAIASYAWYNLVGEVRSALFDPPVGQMDSAPANDATPIARARRGAARQRREAKATSAT